MTAMCPAIETKFQLNMTIDKAYPQIYKILEELALSDLTISKEIPSPSGTQPRKPSFVVLNYTSPRGLITRDNRQIELSLREVEGNTIVSLKWFYPTYEAQRQSSSDLSRAIFSKRAVKVEQNTASLVEEFKSRVGATEVSAESVKEIIKEKTVIVKIRCPYCHNLYDEILTNVLIVERMRK
jgi:hypothetical protein